MSFFHRVQSLKKEFCSGGVPFSCRVSQLFPAVVYLYFKECVTAASSAVLGPSVPDLASVLWKGGIEQVVVCRFGASWWASWRGARLGRPRLLNKQRPLMRHKTPHTESVPTTTQCTHPGHVALARVYTQR